jgi:hypothetical protein
MRKLIGLLMLVCAGSVNAATVVMSDGQLMGATGVEVNGASYDVAFLEGSYNSLYNGGTGLPFTTISGASAASQALIDQVLQPQGINSSNSYLINGIGPLAVPGLLYTATIITPGGSATGLAGSDFMVFEMNPIISSSYTGDTSTPTSPYLFNAGAPIGFIPADEVFAVWTPAAVSAVPLPAAAWLFISAIAGLAGAKRMSRPKGSAQSLQR